MCNLVGKIHSFNQRVFTKHLSYESNVVIDIGQVPQNDNTKQNTIISKMRKKQGAKELEGWKGYN